MGMGSALARYAAARDVFAAVDDALDRPLSRLMAEGPEDELTLTRNAQPALMAVSIAAVRALEEELARPFAAFADVVAGHSLGEYTALAAAGVIGFEDGLALVAERGRAMADAADREPSGMAALLGAGVELAEEVAEARRSEGGRLWVANDNAPGQVVVAGGVVDLEWLEEKGRELGVRRVVRLPVAGAFHSPFMQPAADRVAGAVASASFSDPAFPVYANVTAAPVDPSEVAGLLAAQVVERVRFTETVHNMAGVGVRAFVHIGPGDVTAGMARRSAPETAVLVVDHPDSVAATVEALSPSTEED